MTDQRLIDYIRENLQMGNSADYLTQILLDQGWGIDEINDAFGIVQGRTPRENAYPLAQSPAPPSGTQQAAATPAQAVAPVQQAKKRRPKSITIICVLCFLSAIMMLIAGVLMIGLGSIIGGSDMILTGGMGFPFSGNETSMLGLGEIGSLFGFLGVAFIILGIVNLLGFFLLWKMRKAGWIIVTLSGIITIVIYVINFSFNYMTILSMALFAIIIVYLLLKRKLFA